ncbi:tetratricopeptide repeat protein [Amycolatopsis sp. NPDC004169]|uniref:tetratricopeptide repeat protein n=1 Tax=Amycolatopsis sp. NPDC004169 TaxID=3154453 RepID=UPI0033A9CD7A
MNQPLPGKPTAARPDSAELSWSELADALWLAAHVQLPVPPGAEPAPDAGRDAARPPGEPAPGRPPSPPSPLPESAPDAAAHESVAQPRPEAATGDGVRRGGPALSGKLTIARALRGLARADESHGERVLDAEGTAIGAAETGLWLPMLTPVPEPQLELVVLADESASMAFWTRTVHDFRILLERQGVFRNVRTVLLNSDDLAQPGYRTVAGTGWHRFAELRDPGGRRLFLVVTDGVGPAWRDGAIRGELGELARSGPLAVVNVLPHRLWARTHLDTHPLVLRAPAPAAPNHRLNYTARSRFAPVAEGLPVPVLELDGRWLVRWGKLTGAVEPVRLPALLLGAGEEQPDGWEEPAFEPELSARERVLRFRAAVSPHAFQLASLFAAAPLNLDVMVLIQRTLLPESEYPALLEVVLGGLLTRVSDGAAGEPHAVEFDFTPGVRGELLAAGERRATARVVRIVSDHLGPHVPVMRAARAMLGDPASVPLPDGDPADRPHTEVVRAVMDALGGPYLRYSQRKARIHRRGGPADGASAMRSAEADPVPGGPPVVFEGVPARDGVFTGRERALSALADGLEDTPSTVVVVGEAGTGKSALAAEYVHRRRADYDLVWWIQAGDAAEVVASFAALGRRLGVAGDGDGARDAMTAAKTALRNRPRTLLVFDAAGPPDLIRPLIPAHGHSIVTAQDPGWAAEPGAVECAGFTREERRAFVARVRPGLPDLFGDRPAVLHHVVTFLAGSGTNVSAYTARPSEGGTDGDGRPTAPEIWEVAFGHLRRHEQDAFRLAEACAFFADGFVPSAIVQAAQDVLGMPDSAAASRALVRLGFARMAGDTGPVEFLPLVQAALREWRGNPARTAARRLLTAAWRTSPEQRPAAANLVRHLRACDAVDSGDGQTRELVLDVAAALATSGDPVSAAELAREAGQRWSSRWGADHRDTLAAALVLATSRHAAGEHEAALALDTDVADRAGRLWGADDPMTLAALRNRASDLAALGRHAEAAGLHEAVVTAHDRLFGADHPRSRSARRQERAGFADGREIGRR